MPLSLYFKIAPKPRAIQIVAKANCSCNIGGHGSRSFTSGMVRQKDEDARGDQGGEERVRMLYLTPLFSGCHIDKWRPNACLLLYPFE